MMIFVYAVLVFLVLRFSVTLFNFLSNPKLGYYGKHFTDKVSIIISGDRKAADELLVAIADQDYHNITIIFKNSTEELTLSGSDGGKYLLFLDAKTIIKKGLINNLIYRTKVFNLDFLSLIPNRRISSLYDWCILPLNDFLLLNLFPLRAARLNSQLTFSAVNQECVFYNAESYWRNRNEHSQEQVKLKTEVLLANKFVFIHEHIAFKTVGVRLMKIFGNTVPAIIIYLVLVIAGPIVMFLNYDPAFLLLPLGLIFLTRVMISFLTGQHPLINLLLHPIQLLLLLSLLFSAMWNKLFYPTST